MSTSQRIWVGLCPFLRGHNPETAPRVTPRIPLLPGNLINSAADTSLVYLNCDSRGETKFDI